MKISYHVEVEVLTKPTQGRADDPGVVIRDEILSNLESLDDGGWVVTDAKVTLMGMDTRP